MKWYEAKPGTAETAKLRQRNFTDYTSSDDDDTSDGDSVIEAEDREDLSFMEDEHQPSDGEDAKDDIVLHMHDISYMREAVKQPEKEEVASINREKTPSCQSVVSVQMATPENQLLRAEYPNVTRNSYTLPHENDRAERNAFLLVLRENFARARAANHSPNPGPSPL